MSAAGAPHWDVASYALGVLDPRETARFEDHLAECAECAAELESLLPVTAMLAELDRDDFLRTEQSGQDGRVLREMANVVALDRHRAQTRRLLAVAAGTVALVLAVGLSLFAGSQLGGRPAQVAAPPTATASTPPGIGGPDGPVVGEQFKATDPVSGAQLDLVLASMDWGTAVSLSLAKVTGPLECQLVATGPSGAQIVSSWTVPPDGYGTPKHPDPLFLQGATAMARQDIDKFEVQAVAATGETTVLVSLDV